MNSAPITGNAKPRLIVAPGEQRLEDVCSPECRDLIAEHFDPLWNDTGAELTADQLSERLDGAEVLLTSWGSPALTPATLERAPALRAVAHAAGSIKKLLPPEAFARGIAVFSAAPRIADSVGEFCLAATLTQLRRLPAHDRDMRAGAWRRTGPAARGRELTGAHIGLVGASSTARAFLRLLAPFRVTGYVHDPYLSAPDAERLGVRRASLEEVMSLPVVSLHVPATPETEGMIGRELLARMPDGALLVNTSRGTTVDQDALFEELVSGRLHAALDVFATEPARLPEAVRAAPTVLLTPHQAGDTVEGHRALAEYVLRDALDYLRDGDSGGSDSSSGPAAPSRVDPRTLPVSA